MNGYYSSTWTGSDWGAAVSLSALNSGLHDLTPAIRHHDGTATLYFGRDIGGSNRDIFQSTFDPMTSTWGTPTATPFGANVNTAYNEMSPAVSDDGNFLYFTRNAGAPGYRLYRSAWDTAANQWGTPAPLSFADTSRQQHTPNFDGEYEGATLYFAQHDLTGDWNIYESTWAGSGWSVPTGWNTPTNLGPAFNTGLNELTPAIRNHDGTATLYFARDIGGGNRDLFESTWNPATKTWSTPTAAPFASGVNTTASEMSPSVSDDGDVLYFSRDAGSPGYRLYRSVWDATNSQWSTPLPLSLPVVSSQQHTPNFDGEYEGAKLLFAQYDGTSSAGSWNIYETTWTGSGWSVPTGWGEAENLGSSLNTALHDLTPSVRNHDGTSTLYFARDVGGGNRDLFRSEWDSVAEAWGAATALEFASYINTGASEFCPTVSKDGTLLYFARNVGGYHLYRSVWDDLAGEWGAPTLLDLGDPAKTQHTPNLEAELFGSTLYFAQYDGSSDSAGSWNIYQSVYVPEPTSLLLLGAGLLQLLRRRKKR